MTVDSFVISVEFWHNWSSTPILSWTLFKFWQIDKLNLLPWDVFSCSKCQQKKSNKKWNLWKKKAQKGGLCFVVEHGCHLWQKMQCGLQMSQVSVGWPPWPPRTPSPTKWASPFYSFENSEVFSSHPLGYPMHSLSPHRGFCYLFVFSLFLFVLLPSGPCLATRNRSVIWDLFHLHFDTVFFDWFLCSYWEN